MKLVHADRVNVRRALRGVDLNLFVLFEAVYSAGGLTAAASRLGLTQPAVSHALARLRTALGDALFVRQGPRMVPTPFARSLIGDVRTALDTLQDRLAGNHRFDPGTSETTFRIALRESTEVTLLPRLLERITNEAPFASFVSMRVSRRDFESELAGGGIDLAIDVAAPVSIDIRRRPLTADRHVVAARRDHPRLCDGLSIDAYLALGHVLVSSRRRGGALEDFELNRLGLRRRIALRCQSNIAALKVVERTDLLLTLPARQFSIFHGSPALESFELPFAIVPLDLQLYWHTSADNDPANVWLREIIAASV
jgi:DNA-binding transcriptional LysR family regulator